MDAGRESGEARRKRLARARLYLVCEARPGGRDPEPLLEAALAGGVDLVQLRDKEASDEEIVTAARAFRDSCDRHAALFLLNDRPDLVAACAADGVHVGQDDVPVPEARALAGPDALVGLSTHTRAQIAGAAGVDYVAVGPVFATPTKPGRPAVGLELVAYATEAAPGPFFAIGGIDETNVGAVARAGARRVVVVRAIRDAADPGAVARRLRAALGA